MSFDPSWIKQLKDAVDAMDAVYEMGAAEGMDPGTSILDHL